MDYYAYLIQIVSDRPSESVRVAQLQDELEKKEEVIQRISEENKKLQVCIVVVVVVVVHLT